MEQNKFQQKKDFEDYICNISFDILKKKSLDGKLASCTVRSLCWKLFLGCIPSELERSEWIKALSIHRKEYSALVGQYKVDPHSQGKDLDPLINHPLSQSDESVWKKYWQNLELEKEIRQDIERLYPENDFFQMKHIKEMMQRVLFIYSRQNPQLSYKQGMHELLAPIVYLLEKEKISSQDNDFKEGEEILGMMDSNYIEHDAFMMFNHLMRVVKEWYMLEVKKELSDGGSYSGQDDNEESVTPVVRKCKYIQNVILRKFDPQLYNHLYHLRVEPQVYMLRWIRLLLCREFHIDDTILFWDALFAHSKDFSLVDYISVAMLMYIRQHLLERDFTGCMKRLFKYPPVENIHFLVEKALLLQEGIIAYYNSNNELNAQSSKREIDNRHLNTGQHKNSATTNKNTTVNGESQVKELEFEIQKLQSLQTHMANRLERIIYIIQKEVIERTELASILNDSLVLSVAELKQVKDILGGLLPVEHQLILPPQTFDTTQLNSSNENNSPLVNSNHRDNNNTNNKLNSNEEVDPLGASLLK